MKENNNVSWNQEEFAVCIIFHDRIFQTNQHFYIIIIADIWHSESLVGREYCACKTECFMYLQQVPPQKESIQKPEQNEGSPSLVLIEISTLVGQTSPEVFLDQ